MTGRFQIDCRTLVGLTPFRDIICLNRILEANEFLVLRAVIFNLDTSSINKHNLALTLSHNLSTRVTSNLRLDTGTNDRSVRTQQRNRLTHHVRSHQRTVSVIMFQERDQRSRDRSDLLRSHVHQVNLRRRDNREVSLETSLHLIADKLTVIIQWSITLSDCQLFLFLRRVVLQAFLREVDLSICHLTVRSRDETKIVDLSVYT